MARHGLRVLLFVLGSVALLFGILAVVAGVAQVPDHGPINPNVDSEMRFLGAWYAAAGAALIRASARLEQDTLIIRAASATVFAAGCGRVASIVSVGWPDPSLVALMVVELVIPFVVVPWHNAVRRKDAERPED